MHLLDGGFSAAAHFQLQASGTYPADFHPRAFALIDLETYHSAYMGKQHLKEELEAQIAASAEYTEGRLNYLKDEGQSKLYFILQQEENRQELLTTHRKQLKHKDRIIFALVVFIIILMTGYICLLIYDVMNPEIGFIRGGLQSLCNMIFSVHVFGGGISP